MGYNSTHARKVADRQIKRFVDYPNMPFGGMCILRSAGGDRRCFVFLTDYSAREKQGELIQATDQLGIVSALGPTGAELAEPNNEAEVLVRLNPLTGAETETLRIVAPPGKLDPAGLVIYWELQLRK